MARDESKDLFVGGGYYATDGNGRIVAGVEPPGCPESGPCEMCGGWTGHKRLVADEVNILRAKLHNVMAVAQKVERFADRHMQAAAESVIYELKKAIGE